MAKEKKQEKETEFTKDVEKMKDELTKYVDKVIEKELNQKLKKEFTDEIEKAHKKLMREKNKKIIIRNIVIILLIAIIGFLLYLLYSVGYFDSYFVKEKNDDKQAVIEKSEETKEQETPTLEELKEKYASLLDPITITANSLYLEDYYNGNLTKDLMKYLSINVLDVTKLEQEEDYNLITEEELNKAFQTLFEGECDKNGFDYNNNKIRYIQKLEVYVTDHILEKETSTINREIIDIKEEKDEIVITTIEGIVEEENLYNILTKEQIENYSGDSIINYQESLNTISYRFKNHKLINIEK